MPIISNRVGNIGSIPAQDIEDRAEQERRKRLRQQSGIQFDSNDPYNYPGGPGGVPHSFDRSPDVLGAFTNNKGFVGLLDNIVTNVGAGIAPAFEGPSDALLGAKYAGRNLLFGGKAADAGLMADIAADTRQYSPVVKAARAPIPVDVSEQHPGSVQVAASQNPAIPVDGGGNGPALNISSAPATSMQSAHEPGMSVIGTMSLNKYITDPFSSPVAYSSEDETNIYGPDMSPERAAELDAGYNARVDDSRIQDALDQERRNAGLYRRMVQGVSDAGFETEMERFRRGILQSDLQSSDYARRTGAEEALQAIDRDRQIRIAAAQAAVPAPPVNNVIQELINRDTNIQVANLKQPQPVQFNAPAATANSIAEKYGISPDSAARLIAENMDEKGNIRTDSLELALPKLKQIQNSIPAAVKNWYSAWQNNQDLTPEEFVATAMAIAPNDPMYQYAVAGLKQGISDMSGGSGVSVDGDGGDEELDLVLN